MKKLILALLMLSMFSLVACGESSVLGDEDYEEPIAEKPVIYLYPQEQTDVSVELEFNGELMFTYPEYDDKWEVVAYPDGTIIDDGEEYSYLFWDGISNVDYDLSEGFVVKGEETEAFLKEKLEFLGLTAREYNEFLVYWLPRMVENEYNLISFQGELYTDNAKLTITPEPDSVQRVFMAYKALEEEIEVTPQELQPFQRSGFTVIEWGGAEIID